MAAAAASVTTPRMPVQDTTTFSCQVSERRSIMAATCLRLVRCFGSRARRGRPDRDRHAEPVLDMAGQHCCGRTSRTPTAGRITSTISSTTPEATRDLDQRFVRLAQVLEHEPQVQADVGEHERLEQTSTEFHTYRSCSRV